ncbi:EamA family transporter RarD [Thalassobius sp. Cn5-15]|jgi:chloramphenicol-sensitive protein RarD|uniref:EamA family transporter RarD n=1 Tax=Thalassobius sp. Cn5-15 TaxID=2917763 RepID=UPI001EF39FFE|nr:EamA family transporter RarD [Thalassobius sp. Cn5-15]MCG7494935.1 EamA family transporter RarD [Thalassobius sp. Cn5-15]
MADKRAQNVDTPQGLLYAFGAYFIWGFLPIYMKAVEHIPAIEVVAHRVVWAVPVAATLLFYRRRTADLIAALRAPRMLAMACVTALLISVNWGIYIWSISADRALDAALGYYINPLFSVAIGAVLLGEGLSRTQWIAIALAAAAVSVLWYDAGTLPWPAVGLTVTWGFYAFFKKSLPIGPNQGFLLEVLILLPFGIGFLGYLAATGQGHFTSGAGTTVLLIGLGPMTAIPLLLYANGAKLLKLSTIGILQYVAPTMIFLVAVFVFGEPMGQARMIAFPLIWAALVVYTVPMVRGLRKSRG